MEAGKSEKEPGKQDRSKLNPNKEKPRIRDQKPQRTNPRRMKGIREGRRGTKRGKGRPRGQKKSRKKEKAKQSQSKERHMKTGEGIEEQN